MKPKLVHDRALGITIGTNRHSRHWKRANVSVSMLYERLVAPSVGVETYDEYLKLPKSEQDNLKDVGGFVGGVLNGERRKAVNVIGRDIVTLDFDNIKEYGADSINERTAALGCSYCIYSTRKHIPSKPRLRIIIPLDRTVTPEEYEPIARRLAQQIGIECADKTTFDVSRLMYWPSKCADTEYYYKYQDAPLISADAVLGTYIDWHDASQWPICPDENKRIQTEATKQGDPLEKAGIVGVFCRTYSIPDAMDKFLSGVYIPVDNVADRYTFAGGSTTGGAIVYDDKFLYSHHATDPCGEKLVNAFDLVRLHKYGSLDDNANVEISTKDLPSYKAMCELAVNDDACKITLGRERQAQTMADFGALVSGDTEVNVSDYEWSKQLEYKSDGKIRNTINNYLVILDNDDHLKGKFAYNDFSGRVEALGALPWNAADWRRAWTDADTNGLYWYVEQTYGAKQRGDIDSAFSITVMAHRFNEVRDYITGLSWDGVKRLDTLFIDYLGAEDTIYTRAVTRKMFIAGVARAMTPGVKFDNMLILVGAQGLGKSTLLRRMACSWFNDSICSFEGKEAAELIQGVWLVEISELGAFNKSDTKRIKQFLSLESDYYRAAYARNAEERKRKCIFFGTTNDDEFLRDPTGERRYWPVDCFKSAQTKDPFSITDDEIAQIWAEAKAYWITGEPLHLSKDVEALALEKQQQHKEVSAKAGIIRDFISKKVPADWLSYDIDKRREFWHGTRTAEAEAELHLTERDRVSAVEIWVECFDGDPRWFKQADAREINGIIGDIEGWSRTSVIMRNGVYGHQRCYVREKC